MSVRNGSINDNITFIDSPFTDAVLDRFLTGMPQRLNVANGPVTMNSVLLDIDPDTGQATAIQRIDRTVD